MASQDHVRKASEWTQRLKRFQSSGLSVAKFCELERVAPYVFYYWVRRFRTTGSEAVELNDDQRSHRVRRRDDSVVVSTATTSSVELRLASGIQISIPADSMCFGSAETGISRLLR
jgi:hypothetical protein